MVFVPGCNSFSNWALVTELMMNDIELNQCVLPAFNLVQVAWTSAQTAFRTQHSCVVTLWFALCLVRNLVLHRLYKERCPDNCFSRCGWADSLLLTGCSVAFRRSHNWQSRRKSAYRTNDTTDLSKLESNVQKLLYSRFACQLIGFEE